MLCHPSKDHRNGSGMGARTPVMVAGGCDVPPAHRPGWNRGAARSPPPPRTAVGVASGGVAELSDVMATAGEGTNGVRLANVPCACSAICGTGGPLLPAGLVRRLAR